MNLEDLNLDPIAATEVLSYMHVHPAEIHDPAKQTRLKEVVSFFQKAEDKRFLINKLLAGKAVDPIDHLWGYVQVRKDHQQKSHELQRLTEELSIYEQ